MERIWSPWRSQHIDSLRDATDDGEAEGSLFSRIAAQERDEENLVVYRGRQVFVVMNLYPYNNGHLLVVPYREVASYADLTPAEREEMGDILTRCLEWLDKAMAPEGFNVGMNIGKAAGAGVPRHLHMHVVPRWEGDTNFMPTIADVKVVPEAMLDTYRKLRHAAQASP